MTTIQKAIKAFAVVLAIFLSISIISGIISAVVAVMLGVSSVVRIGENLSGITKTEESKMEQKEIIEYNIEEIEKVNIEVGYSKINIKTIDTKKFEIKTNQSKKRFEIEIKDKELKIKQNGNGFKEADNCYIELLIPKEKILEEINIETGANSCNIESLNIKDIKIKNGAGEIIINNLKSDGLNLENGAGNVEINNSLVKKSDISTGAGSIFYKGKITDEGNFETGVGKSEIELIDTDYKIIPSIGLGKITLDNEICLKEKEYGTGNIKITVDVGIGETIIKTK